MRRRSVLHGIGAGAVTVVVAATGVLSYRTYDNGVLDSGSGTPYDAWSHWRQDPGLLGMVATGILAANPHNSQPWIFTMTGTTIDVFADTTRGTGTLDPLGREHAIGLGCAIENIVLAAAARGYTPVVKFLPQLSDKAPHAATISLSPGPVSVSPLYEAIGDRHSNRGPYTSAAVSASTIAALGAHADGLPGVAVRWFTTAAEKAAFSALIMKATTAVTLDARQSHDAFIWFRDTRDEIMKHMDGLTLDGQGLDALTLTLGKLLPAETEAQGNSFWVTQTRNVHTKTAAAYGVITVADPADVVSRLNGGRLLERIHLAVTAGGLALQHMNQITERIDRESTQGITATFAPAFDTLLAQPGRHPLGTFRIGYPVRTARLSPRRPLAAVVEYGNR